MMNMKQFGLVRDASFVRQAHGKGFLRQAIEILQARWRNPTLGATDYFKYRLYDRNFLGTSRPEEFLGWRAQESLPLALNARSAVLPGWDKLTFALFACAFGLPVPRLICLYRPGPSPSSNLADVAFNELNSLADWLRTQDHWPLFSKPSYSQGGQGCYYLAGYSEKEDMLVTSRERIPVKRFVNEIVGGPAGPYFQPEMGYLFQEVLRPHPDIANLLGNNAISCVRLVVLHHREESVPVTAFWKLVIGDNHTDNIHGFTSGNLTGEIDLRTGRLGRVLDGFGPRGKVVAESPRTSHSFEGFILPQWHEAIALCIRAARLFPLMRMQCWDVAITDRGPVLVELNDIPDVAVMQMWGQGLLSTPMRAAIQEFGAKRFPWLRS